MIIRLTNLCGPEIAFPAAAILSDSYAEYWFTNIVSICMENRQPLSVPINKAVSCSFLYAFLTSSHVHIHIEYVQLLC